MYDELIFADCDHSRDPVLGCALEGVASIIAGIRDVSVVIHSPQGCAATVAMAFDSHEIDFTRRKIACTRLFETDIIMGASEKLENLIKETDRTFNNTVIFVVGTCAADIIGENLEGLCQSIQPEVSAKLIPIVAGGFRGSIYEGMELGLKALLPLIKKSTDKIPNSVNIIAPQANLNPTWFGDLKWVTDILQNIGIKVQTVLSHDTSLSQLEDAGLASANILLSHDTGFVFARKMQELHGIPLILADIPLPVGLTNTARWLKTLGVYFDVEDQVSQLIQSGEERVVDILRRRALMMVPRYRNCKIAVSADATIGIGLVRLLFEELEMIPELLLYRSQTPESRKILERELNGLGLSPQVAFAVDGFQTQQALKEIEVDAVIGSAWEKYIAEELGIKIVFDILAPTNRDIYLDRAYFGYEGMLNMLEIIGNDWERTFRSKAINAAEYQAG
jgi:light-independent protochlorophyllide reductase B subunit